MRMLRSQRHIPSAHILGKHSGDVIQMVAAFMAHVLQPLQVMELNCIADVHRGQKLP